MGFHELFPAEARKQPKLSPRRTAFPHQVDALAALSSTFDLSSSKGVGALLVLPTGAGKTYTTVSWLCDHALKQNVKVLWLAHSFYLLDQACQEFCGYAPWMPASRERVAVRVVSSATLHDPASDIATSDDVVIITTQTATTHLHLQASDRRGKRATTPLRAFVERAADTGLFVVLDEAHHAPACGCRNLLVGKDEAAPGLRALVPSANLLGLTATPTYTDETRRGWLGRIFEKGAIYEADQAKLTAQGILARPQYVPRPTGTEIAVGDELYDRLVREHQDLPEEIITDLANNSARNDAIVQEYAENRTTYGKTIIFADRWYQCVYLKRKLRARGVKADAVYSHIDADPGSAEAREKRTAKDNERIFNEFKFGRDKDGNDKLDVLINVRMLTEGTDVPSVQTVFLTRQTTSRILLKQMIGRALRGRQAGGGDEANIVMFMDDWKRLVDWASPVELTGGTEEGRIVRGYYPLEYVAIRLVEKLTDHLNNPDAPLPPFSSLMPAGWYQTEYVSASSDVEQPQSLTQFVVVYEHTKAKFDGLIRALLSPKAIPLGWDREHLPMADAEGQVSTWASRFFRPDEDDLGGTLAMDVMRIARHVAQRTAAPAYYSFEDRDQHNLDALAARVLRRDRVECDESLRAEFAKPGRLWETFFGSFERFAAAVDGACQRALYERRYGTAIRAPEPPPATRRRRRRELSEEEKKQVKERDGYKCLCCGASGKGVRLQTDHITAYALTGETSVSNSQTLCSLCNRDKGVNEMNFMQTETQLAGPKDLVLLPPIGDAKRSLRRIANAFYHCGAVCAVRLHERRNGGHYYDWEIELYEGNDPEWLNRCESALLGYVRDELGYPHVKSVRAVGPK